MNIYIRYFDEEAICHNMDEMEDFLYSIKDIKVTQKMLDEIARYAQDAANTYSRKYKVGTRNYFIMIKTQLNTLAEFHANGKEVGRPDKADGATDFSIYDEHKPGWYRCVKNFKRMVPSAGGHKSEYRECSIEVLVKCDTARQCHNRIVKYLQDRPDVDRRSQYPKMGPASFSFEYKGETLEQDDTQSKA